MIESENEIFHFLRAVALLFPPSLSRAAGAAGAIMRVEVQYNRSPSEDRAI